jgi:lysophospholipase L1-like esterase
VDTEDTETLMTNRRRLVGILLSGLIAVASLVPVVVAAGQDRTVGSQAVIVFVGSSIFHRWTNLTTQLAPLPVVNRGVDGFRTADMLRILDSDVVPARPKLIVYYCGSNDVDAGEPAAAIVDRIRQFVVRVAAALPETRVVFVSINRAPEKRDLWDVVDAVNHRVEAYAADTKQLQYVDVNPVLFNRDGTPRVELYLSDQLHFRPAGYDELSRVLKPVLAKAFNSP